MTAGAGAHGSPADPFEYDDAAYVLGGLEPADREAFQAHLAECAACTSRVLALGPVTGLLAGVDAGVVTALEGDPAPAAAISGASPEAAGAGDCGLASLVQLVDRRRRRRRWTLTGLGTAAAAAIVVLAVLLVGSRAGQQSPPVAAQQMTATADSPVRATASVTGTAWGTEITLNCRYASGGGYAYPGTYSLQVVDRSGHRHDLGSWSLTPGARTQFTSGTALASNDIGSIQVVEPDGTVALTLSE